MKENENNKKKQDKKPPSASSSINNTDCNDTITSRDVSLDGSLYIGYMEAADKASDPPKFRPVAAIPNATVRHGNQELASNGKQLRRETSRGEHPLTSTPRRRRRRTSFFDQVTGGLRSAWRGISMGSSSHHRTERESTVLDVDELHFDGDDPGHTIATGGLGEEIDVDELEAQKIGSSPPSIICLDRALNSTLAGLEDELQPMPPRPTQRRSLPGAFRVHPGGIVPTSLSSHASETLTFYSLAHSADPSDERSIGTIVVPRASLVDDASVVVQHGSSGTFHILYAAPLDLSVSQGTTEDAVVLNRRFVKCFVLVVIVLVLTLTTALYFALKADVNQPDITKPPSPRPRPPPPPRPSPPARPVTLSPTPVTFATIVEDPTVQPADLGPATSVDIDSSGNTSLPALESVLGVNATAPTSESPESASPGSTASPIISPSNTTGMETIGPKGFETGNPTFISVFSPSQGPTGNPSWSPSLTPSDAPSRLSSAPSQDPSNGPSHSPPSAAPSTVPSHSSFNPTQAPSIRSTLDPSSAPTIIGTMSPSLDTQEVNALMHTTAQSTTSGHPSSVPSSTHTLAASKEPSPQPSTEPTSTESGQPSSPPTPKPAIAPSSMPSPVQSSKPTPKPTDDLTLGPSSAPSSSRTGAPTPGLTDAPLTSPTRGPTANPTAVPTETPSTSPSSRPTISPTAQPTRKQVSFTSLSIQVSLPTAAPARTPTVEPTDAHSTPPPTRLPTRSPTWPPTRSPTDRPTRAPVQVNAITNSNDNGNNNDNNNSDDNNSNGGNNGGDKKDDDKNNDGRGGGCNRRLGGGGGGKGGGDDGCRGNGGGGGGGGGGRGR